MTIALVHNNREAELEAMKSTIEKMSKLHHVEILRILKKHGNLTINETRHGIFINLSFLPSSVIDEIQQYLTYIRDQEEAIKEMEIRQQAIVTGAGEVS